MRSTNSGVMIDIALPHRRREFDFHLIELECVGLLRAFRRDGRMRRVLKAAWGCP